MLRNILSACPTISLLLLCLSCSQSNSSHRTETISSDSATVAKGGTLFSKNCSSCHNFKQAGIGPELSGITSEVSVDWIHQMIKDSKSLIESGDKRADSLFKKYKVPMLSFASLADDEVDAITAFLNTKKKAVKRKGPNDANALVNPIKDSIEMSNLVVGLQLVATFPASSDSGKLPLTRITKLGFEPNSKRNFIIDLRGKLYRLQNNKPVLYMDIAKLRQHFINEPGLATGFGSFAFHPEFAKNGLVYTTHTEAPNSGKADFSYGDSLPVVLQWVLTEWKTDKPNASKFSGTGRELLRINMITGMHGVQEISFNPLSKPGDKDYGLLYIGVGDGGSVDEGYPFIAHSKQKIWGSIIRIDPTGSNSANKQYGIPTDNPFAGSSDNTTIKEIYAYGFRNPHRITWTKNGTMLASHVGGGNIETIDLIEPGKDYGWPIREGTFMLYPDGDLSKVFSLPANDSTFHISYPVVQYDHDSGATAICGGFEYWGNKIPALKGKFLFGDIPSGRLFYAELADMVQGKQAKMKQLKIAVNGSLKTLKQLCKNDRPDLHLGRDAKGELYILTKPDGKMYKIITAAAK